MKGIMNNKAARALALTLALMLALVPAASLAAVELTASVGEGEGSFKEGDTVEVIITLTGKDIAAAEGSYTYDPYMLTYVESDGGASDGYISLISLEKGGADSLSARITFTARRDGEVSIDFTIDKALNYKGEDIGSSDANVKLSVSPGPEPTPSPTPISYAAEGVKAHNVANAATDMYVWRSIENVTIPSRYSESTYDYHGETVAAAIVVDSDAPVLLYVTDDTGELGGYHIYDAASDTLYPYQTISSVSKSYIILEPGADVSVPEGFSETTLTLDEKVYRAWVANDAQGALYLLYARNPSGETGFFVYNTEDSSMQRYAVMPARPMAPTLPPDAAATPAPTPIPMPMPTADIPAPEHSGGMNISPTLFYALCGVAGVLLLALIGLIVYYNVEKARRMRRVAQRKAARDKALRDISATTQGTGANADDR